jgi:nicotinamide mononucleotide transporter
MMLSLEAVAVVLAIAYLLFATYEHIACWYCAFFSSAIFVAIFWDVSLLMESVLNVFYVVMALFGWFTWRYGGKEHEGVPIRLLKGWQHVAILVFLLLATSSNGWFMQQNTTAVWPYLDAFTTWASVITTFMVVWKVLENWLYWLVIDSISIFLYIDRELYLTALLFSGYVVIVIFGFIQWRKKYRHENHANTND